MEANKIILYRDCYLKVSDVLLSSFFLISVNPDSGNFKKKSKSQFLNSIFGYFFSRFNIRFLFCYQKPSPMDHRSGDKLLLRTTSI